MLRRKCNGAQAGHRSHGSAEGIVPRRAVGERSVVGRRQTARTAGRGGSENAGMSSEKAGENPARRKPKGS